MGIDLSKNKTKIAGSKGDEKPSHKFNKGPMSEILKWTTFHMSKRVTYSNDRD